MAGFCNRLSNVKSRGAFGRSTYHRRRSFRGKRICLRLGRQSQINQTEYTAVRGRAQPARFQRSSAKIFHVSRHPIYVLKNLDYSGATMAANAFTFSLPYSTPSTETKEVNQAISSKVPQITIAFWIIKIAATTLGETGGDALSMSLNLGYLLSTAI